VSAGAAGGGVVSVVVVVVAVESVVAAASPLPPPQDATKRPNVSARILNFTNFIKLFFRLLCRFIPGLEKGNPSFRNYFKNNKHLKIHNEKRLPADNLFSSIKS
jgi:hypothetical protein